MTDKWKTAAAKIDRFISEQAKPQSRAKRIKSLMEDSAMSRKEAAAWVGFEGDAKTNAPAR